MRAASPIVHRRTRFRSRLSLHVEDVEDSARFLRCEQNLLHLLCTLISNLWFYVGYYGRTSRGQAYRQAFVTLYCIPPSLEKFRVSIDQSDFVSGTHNGGNFSPCFVCVFLYISFTVQPQASTGSVSTTYGPPASKYLPCFDRQVRRVLCFRV